MRTMRAADPTSAGEAAAFAPRATSGCTAAALVSNTHNE